MARKSRRVPTFHKNALNAAVRQWVSEKFGRTYHDWEVLAATPNPVKRPNNDGTIMRWLWNLHVHGVQRDLDNETGVVLVQIANHPLAEGDLRIKGVYAVPGKQFYRIPRKSVALYEAERSERYGSWVDPYCVYKIDA